MWHPELILEMCIPKKEPIPWVDLIPAGIRIKVIPTPALLDMVPAPDPDPLKRGIVTPLGLTFFAPSLDVIGKSITQTCITALLPILHASTNCTIDGK